jgi:hypothetical protein
MANIITKKQRAVLDEIFDTGLSETDASTKHGIDAATYRKWLKDETYQNEMQLYIESAQRQGRLLIARHCAFAAAKLVGLANSDKEETARKACLDIIGAYQTTDNRVQSTDSEQQTDLNIPPEKAERILQILAGKNHNDNDE